MKYAVCTNYYGAVVDLDYFNTKDEAEDFMKRPCIMFYADEIEDAEEDEVIYPYEMWIEEDPKDKDDVPFCDVSFDDLPDDMPF